MASSVRSRRLSKPNKPSIRARQAALEAASLPAQPPRLAVDHIAHGVDARPFLRQVREALDGNILRYSDRLRLIREAERMGIPRFEANLLIATVQHRAQQQHAPVPELATSPATTSRAARIVLLTSALLTAEFFLLRFVMHALAGT